MTQIAKRDFDVLDLTGQRHPQWKDDIIAHLGAMGLEHTIEETHIFIRHHMNEGLKNEYIRVRDLYDLLNRLEARFGHHHDVLLPKLREECKNLRSQDFTPINDGSAAILEANAIDKFGHGRWNNRRGRGRGRGDGLDKKNNNFKKPRIGKQVVHSKRVSKPKGACLKCGLIGHWARACRTPKHFADIYQASNMQANKGPEARFISDAIPLISYMSTSNTLNIADYLIDDIAGSSNL
ncbi:hypothetical protein RND81_09G081500 [Saponaria officinalis]|uniref:CCHC-type domain-containing protein n=1 Tax=Saponaria officinalis TaxID=3572 RepID=A0AAW1IJX8_SAPOF